VAVADGLVYAVDIDGGIHCLDADSGKPYWVHQAKADIYAPALVADGRVYVGTAKGLVVMAAAKELQVLHRLDSVKMWTAPVAANGTLYLAARERLWAVAREGTLPACVSPASGPEGGRAED
jgi:outer membrane protein assembly factor BamB